MHVSKCSKCGSTEFEVSKYQPRDFASRYSFVSCVRCGESAGVVDFFAVQDMFRRHDEPGKRLARLLLEKQELV